MLVKCPECDADISSMANPCPQCGFLYAGWRSKKMVESRFLEIKNDPIRFLNRKDDYGVHCNWNFIHRGFFGKIHTMAVKSCILCEDGYSISIELYCLDCGRIQKYPNQTI